MSEHKIREQIEAAITDRMYREIVTRQAETIRALRETLKQISQSYDNNLFRNRTLENCRILAREALASSATETTKEPKRDA